MSNFSKKSFNLKINSQNLYQQIYYILV